MKPTTTFGREQPTRYRPPLPIPAGERSYYLPGDGDVKAIRRPGSDHSHIKSRGQLC
jgi:hypothetical protein